MAEGVIGGARCLVMVVDHLLIRAGHYDHAGVVVVIVYFDKYNDHIHLDNQ